LTDRGHHTGQANPKSTSLSWRASSSGRLQAALDTNVMTPHNVIDTPDFLQRRLHSSLRLHVRHRDYGYLWICQWIDEVQ